MTRPAVSVVMPFAGDAAAADAALRALRSLDTGPDDELILADNSGIVGAAADVAVVRAAGDVAVVRAAGDVAVVRAAGERSPAHARNAGARHATREWILFLDADCRPAPGLLEAYFSEPVAAEVGALAGEVRPAPGAATVAGRYGAQRAFLSQQAHLAHPYRPRAAAANLMVRRAAFEQVGGFYEGLRAAEDTDFSWRLQEAGWRLELRGQATVEHRYRATLGELRRQWRGYAAGRAWLARRYEGFVPEPAAARALGRGLRAARRRPRAVGGRDGSAAVSRLERGRFAILDAVLGLEELAGLALSNRPDAGRERQRDGGSVQAVLIAESFPAEGDPLVELALTLDDVAVEAAARPRHTDVGAAAQLAIDYREDDGLAARGLALAALVARHPVRCVRDRVRRAPGEPGLSALAPAVRRLERHSGARVVALGRSRAVAQRIAALAGRALDSPRRGRWDG